MEVLRLRETNIALLLLLLTKCYDVQKDCWFFNELLAMKKIWKNSDWLFGNESETEGFFLFILRKLNLFAIFWFITLRKPAGHDSSQAIENTTKKRNPSDTFPY